MYDDALMREPWQQGRLLRTQQVKRWERNGQTIEIKQAQQKEARTIFARFSAEDEGRSRIHIATCETAGEAEFIVKAHNYLLDLYKEACEDLAHAYGGDLHDKIPD